MKRTHIGRGLLILLLVSVCVLGFVTSRKADAAKSASANSQFIDPEDMEHGEYYVFWDHGSGAMVVQYDRMDNGTISNTNGIIYNTFSMTPSQSLFSINTSCTVYDAGNIQPAGSTAIAHLLRCILAGSYVP